MGKSPRNATATILRKSPRPNPSILKGYTNDESKRISSERQLDFDYVVGIREIHPNNLTKKALLNKDKTKKLIVQLMRNTRSTVVKHQNNHPMLHLFGKLCEKYLPGENDGVLTYMINDNVF